MAELDLPSGPAELLEAVRKPLGDHLGGEHHLRLGGGTALAARWGHRHSTDLHLFVDPEAYARLYGDPERLRGNIARHTGAVEQFGVGPGYTLIAVPDGEVIVLTTRSLTPGPVSGDFVRGTRVAIETNAEILAKKLTHRLSIYHLFVPRDLYDIAVARHLDPEALDTALATIPAPNLDDIRKQLGLLGPGWAAGHHEPLLQPTFPRDAADSVAVVRRVIGRALGDTNPPPPSPDAPPFRSR
ncbi:MAG: nucleotidyl transferase AbiEii/AbiGii toxin family protein [Gemmatimonadota bacterium]|nr:nucleotidyl transferase AbiEii/AbiGii toxin family protein [Gemmatimonadota bacterium]MDE2871393.1 nucleotidyl transferase AbiEii/AbiGii toxin family protein [Gemmatimonadota bacterium]